MELIVLGSVQKKIAASRSIENATELAVAYHKGKKCFDQLLKYDFQQLKISMKEEKPIMVKELMNLTTVTPVQFLERTVNVNTDIRKIHLRFFSETYLDGNYVRDGTFLSSGEFIISIRNSKRGSKGNDECLIYNEYGELKKKITYISKPFGIIQHGKEIIVACTDSSFLKFFDTKNLQFCNDLGIWKKPYCFTSFLIDRVTYLYVACGDLIIQIPKDGGYYEKHHTGLSVSEAHH